MLTIINKRIAVRVTNTMESANLIKKNTQIAEFSIVSPEQSKHIKPVDMATLSMIPQGDPDRTAHLNELLRTNKPEQQKKTFSVSQHQKVPENPRITPQVRHESSKDYLNLKRKKNPFHNRAQNPEANYSNDSIDWHFGQKQTNKQLKRYWWTTLTFSPDTEWRLRWTRNSRWK